jgi:hypothetical protein
VLRAVGRIELEGEGAQAEIRRDIALMISRGHLNAVSVRAQGDKAIPRQDLPKGEPCSEVSEITDLRSLEGFLRDAGASRSEAKRVISLLKSDEEPETKQDPPRDVERKESETWVRDVQTLIRSEFTELKNEIYRECQQLLNHALGRVQTP